MCKKWAILLAICLIGLMPSPVLAGPPDYTIPGGFVLPWHCGGAYRVSWTPPGHWAHHKATGIAYDFALPEGVPLFAPTNGHAYFLYDERPLPTTFGHYVEIVSEDGNWLIRLAHLRDPQFGERTVRVGELIGYSGSSGVPSPHLHLELLVRQGERWVRPDPLRLHTFFGVPVADLVEGALISNRGCQARIALAGGVHLSKTQLTLGESLGILLPLRNESSAPLTLKLIQLSLRGPGGNTLIAEAHGPWQLPPQEERTIQLAALPDMPGRWQLGSIVYQAASTAGTLSAQGTFTVAPPPLLVRELSLPQVVEAGTTFALTIELENAGQGSFSWEDLIIEGSQPNGALWQASLGRAGSLAPGESHRFLLENRTIPYQVGIWKALRLRLRQRGRSWLLSPLEGSFAVLGPELRVSKIASYSTARALSVSLLLTNMGTRSIRPDKVELWGWKPGGEEPFIASAQVLRAIAPGGSALVRLSIPLQGAAGRWQCSEAGYWFEGSYYPMALPAQPAATVPSP